MIIGLLLWTVWNGLAASVNVALYIDSGWTISLAAGLFCSLMFIVSAAWLIVEVRGRDRA